MKPTLDDLTLTQLVDRREISSVVASRCKKLGFNLLSELINSYLETTSFNFHYNFPEQQAEEVDRCCRKFLAYRLRLNSVNLLDNVEPDIEQLTRKEWRALNSFFIAKMNKLSDKTHLLLHALGDSRPRTMITRLLTEDSVMNMPHISYATGLEFEDLRLNTLRFFNGLKSAPLDNNKAKRTIYKASKK